MEAISNGIPLTAIILEPIIAIFMTYLSIRTYMKYRQRRNRATLFLALAILGLALANWSSAIGKYLNYFTFQGKTVEEMNYAGFTILIAYAISALANIFAVGFIAEIFREENSRMPMTFATFNGVTIGLIVANLSFAENAYDNVLIPLFWHIFVSLYTYFSLLIFSIRESRITKQSIPRTGFRLIGAYGLFVAMVFILFILDLIVVTLTGQGYSPFYYAAWISGGVASFFGYLGYVMPEWFRRRLE